MHIFVVHYVSSYKDACNSVGHLARNVFEIIDIVSGESINLGAQEL